MKNSKIMIVGAGAVSSLIMSTSASAVLTGLSMFAEPVGGIGPPPTGGPRTIFRIYADFTSSTDRVNAWGIGSDFGPGSIKNVLVDNTTPGTGFTNIGGPGGQLAPYYSDGLRDWDTFMTIGVLYGAEAPAGADATAQIPNTPVFISGNNWVPDQTNGGGVYITPNDPQGAANYRVSGNDTDHRVLLMQLVVNAGQQVKGTIGIAWAAAGQNGVVTQGLVFDIIPAPGALPLLACAGLIGARRRRR